MDNQVSKEAYKDLPKTPKYSLVCTRGPQESPTHCRKRQVVFLNAKLDFGFELIDQMIFVEFFVIAVWEIWVFRRMKVVQYRKILFVY